MAAFFEDGSPAMVELEKMVDAVGVRNVLYALARIACLKSEHVATNWQDSALAAAWERYGKALDACASNSRLVAVERVVRP